MPLVFLNLHIRTIGSNQDSKVRPKTCNCSNGLFKHSLSWEQAGVWGRFWAGLPQEQLDGASALFVDSTPVRAHQHASGAPKNANDAALGRSRGGLTSKIHAATLNENQAVVIQLTLGQARGKRHRVRRPRQRLRHQRHPRPLILGRHRAGHPRTLQPHRTHRG